MSKKRNKKSPAKAMSESEFENSQNQLNEEAITEEENVTTSEIDNPVTEDEIIDAPIYNEENQNLESSDTPNEEEQILPEEPTENLDEEKPNGINNEESLEEEKAEDLNEETTSNEEALDSEEENPVEPPVEEIHDHVPPTKKKMDKKQKKILIITILSIILAIGIILSISLPIYFHFKDKVMVSTAEDFQNVDKGKYYVLNKDVLVEGDLDLSQLGNYSIDLHGHSLTVNGDLKYASEDEMTINIGNIKKKEYTSGGILQVNGTLIYEVPNSTINLLSSNQVGSAKIAAKKANLESLTASTNIDISAGEVNITGTMQTDASAFVNISNSNVNVSGNINSNVNLVTSNITVNPTVEIDKMILDEMSNAQIYGKIKTSLSGGNKVAMLMNHACGEYNNVKNLALYRADAKDYTIKNCDRIVYIDKLEKPVDFLIEERPDGKIFAVSSFVPHASSYLFTIDGKEYLTTDNFLDISTQMVEGGPGSHVITVTPKGNFIFDNFETTERPENPNEDILYVDGDTANTDFAYKITLETPQNLTIDSTSTENKILLKFSSVSFASGYKVVINGTEFTVKNEATPMQSIDITEYVQNVGTYSIRVNAYSDVAEIEASKQAMTSYTKVVKLDAVTNINATIDTGFLNITFDGPENASSYIIYAQNAQGDKIELGRTSLKEFSIEETMVKDYDSVIIVAQGTNYYTPSEATSSAIVRP